LTWFLETLKNDLGIANTGPQTIMSDKQKGLINAVKAVFPNTDFVLDTCGKISNRNSEVMH
jgi:hypothetical protein